MRRIVILIPFFVLILLACHTSKKVITDNSISDKSESSLTGKELVKESDCYTCHSEASKMVGPSWLMIADKYSDSETTIEILSKKIITGGPGTWGNIPMVPHSGMSIEKAKTIVKYILTFKQIK